MVSIGRVTRPWGNRGEVTVAPDTDFGDTRFSPGAEIFVQPVASVLLGSFAASETSCVYKMMAMRGDASTATTSSSRPIVFFNL